MIGELLDALEEARVDAMNAGRELRARLLRELLSRDDGARDAAGTNEDREPLERGGGERAVALRQDEALDLGPADDLDRLFRARRAERPSGARVG